MTDNESADLALTVYAPSEPDEADLADGDAVDPGSAAHGIALAAERDQLARALRDTHRQNSRRIGVAVAAIPPPTDPLMPAKAGRPLPAKAGSLLPAKAGRRLPATTARCGWERRSRRAVTCLRPPA